MIPQPAADPIDARVVKALSHPTRVRILELLQVHELASPVELSQELEIPLGTISYHVRRLEQLGFIELATRTQRRGAIEHHYRVRAALDLPRARRRPAAVAVAGSGQADVALRTLDEAQAALARGGFDAVQARADSRTLALDARGLAQVRAALARWAARAERVERASARRLARADGGGHMHVATALLLLAPEQ